MSNRDRNRALQLKVVGKVVQYNVNEIEKKLKNLFFKKNQEEQKLLELIGFRKEYEDKSLRDDDKKCISIQQAQNHRKFISKLSYAITTQQDAVKKILVDLEINITNWKQNNNKNKAIDNLITQYENQYHNVQQYAEQSELEHILYRHKYLSNTSQ